MAPRTPPAGPGPGAHRDVRSGPRTDRRSLDQALPQQDRVRRAVDHECTGGQVTSGRQDSCRAASRQPERTLRVRSRPGHRIGDDLGDLGRGGKQPVQTRDSRVVCRTARLDKATQVRPGRGDGDLLAHDGTHQQLGGVDRTGYPDARHVSNRQRQQRVSRQRSVGGDRVVVEVEQSPCRVHELGLLRSAGRIDLHLESPARAGGTGRDAESACARTCPERPGIGQPVARQVGDLHARHGASGQEGEDAGRVIRLVHAQVDDRSPGHPTGHPVGRAPPGRRHPGVTTPFS